eukprot:172905-Chlamydomonas_euryale.AAC.9
MSEKPLGPSTRPCFTPCFVTRLALASPRLCHLPFCPRLAPTLSLALPSPRPDFVTRLAMTLSLALPSPCPDFVTRLALACRAGHE